MQVMPSSFHTLFDAHHSHVRAVVLRLLRDPGEADDVTQDVFVQAWRQMDRFDATRGEVRAWLSSIARSRAMDRVRRRLARARMHHALVGRVGDPHQDPHEPENSGRDADRLRLAFTRLSPASRAVLELAYFEHLSQREIAAEMGETLGVIKSRLRQGLAVLREGLNTSGECPRAPLDLEPVPLTTTLVRRESSLPSLSGVRVLLVDDDRRTRCVLHALLTRAGAVATPHASAGGALDALASARPDVLLADLNMPGTDGLDLIRAIRRMDSPQRELPAIAFTGRAHESDRTAALSAGFHLHMSKPVHPLAVVTAVRKLCEPHVPLPR